MDDSADRTAFILGMVTAFAECVARESKRAALSPPFLPSDLEDAGSAIEDIAKENGIFCRLDRNPDLPVEQRVYWYVLYKFPEVIDEYDRLRKEGLNPARKFSSYFNFLGYGRAWIDTYDSTIPVFREERPMKDTVARVLFAAGGWPIQ